MFEIIFISFIAIIFIVFLVIGISKNKKHKNSNINKNAVNKVLANNAKIIEVKCSDIPDMSALKSAPDFSDVMLKPDNKVAKEQSSIGLKHRLKTYQSSSADYDDDLNFRDELHHDEDETVKEESVMKRITVDKKNPIRQQLDEMTPEMKSIVFGEVLTKRK